MATIYMYLHISQVHPQRRHAAHDTREARTLAATAALGGEQYAPTITAMPSRFDIPTPFDRAGRVADPVIAALEESGSEPEIMYCIGMAPWAEDGECLAAIGLATPSGRAWVLTDRFEACWLVLHRSGTAGLARPFPEHDDVNELVEECCRFLAGLDPVPFAAGGKLS